MKITQIVSRLELMANLFIFIHNGGIYKLLHSPHLKMVLFFFGYESLSKGCNVLNEFMFQSRMRFCLTQWLAKRFYGRLSVSDSRPLPSEKKKNSPFAAQLKIAFRRFLSSLNYVLKMPLLNSFVPSLEQQRRGW